MPEWEKYKNGCYKTLCLTLGDFTKAVKEVYKSDNKILFRGHSKSEEYKLISKIDRNYESFITKVKKTGMSDVHRITRNSFIENQLFEFRKKIRGKVDSERYFEDDELAWSLGQHYGLDTPYLDWTETPYIATFFSVITNAETDGCIYALDLSKIDEMNKKALCNETLKSFINNKAIEDYAINVIQPMTNFITRLNAQNGCFTVAPDGLSIDDWISCFEKYKDRKVLRKIVIQGSIKKELLDFLETVNINYSTIYPDLQGIRLIPFRKPEI